METCVWTLILEEFFGGYYETDCGNSFYFETGNVVDNEFHFCPYCGRRILVQP